MAKQATRLSDFQIPRSDGVTSERNKSKEPSIDPEVAVVVERPRSAPEHLVVPVRIAPRPAAESRQAMTVRLPVSMHERIRMLMFASRRSQQDIVEEALNAFLSANET